MGFVEIPSCVIHSNHPSLWIEGLQERKLWYIWPGRVVFCNGYYIMWFGVEKDAIMVLHYMLCNVAWMCWISVKRDCVHDVTTRFKGRLWRRPDGLLQHVQKIKWFVLKRRCLELNWNPLEVILTLRIDISNFFLFPFSFDMTRVHCATHPNCSHWAAWIRVDFGAVA